MRHELLAMGVDESFIDAVEFAAAGGVAAPSGGGGASPHVAIHVHAPKAPKAPKIKGAWSATNNPWTARGDKPPAGITNWAVEKKYATLNNLSSSNPTKFNAIASQFDTPDSPGGFRFMNLLRGFAGHTTGDTGGPPTADEVIKMAKVLKMTPQALVSGGWNGQPLAGFSMSTAINNDLARFGVDPNFISALAMFDGPPVDEPDEEDDDIEDEPDDSEDMTSPEEDNGLTGQRSPIEIHVHHPGYGPDDASKTTVPPPDPSQLQPATPPPEASAAPATPDSTASPAPQQQGVHPAILHAIGVAQQAAATALQHASNAMQAAHRINGNDQLDQADETDEGEDSEEQLPRLTTTPDRHPNVNMYPPQKQIAGMSDERKRELMTATSLGNQILWDEKRKR